MAAVHVERINVLSRAKKIHPGFLEDRRSVYWIEKWPPTVNADGRTEFAVTGRLDVLAQPKTSHMKYKGDSCEFLEEDL